MNKKQTDKFRMLAKTLFGLEPLLAEELKQLGATEIKVRNRAIEFFGDRALLYRANLCCRLAGRILVPIGRFRAHNADSLYRAISKIDWSRYMDVDDTLAIDAIISRSPFDNSMFVGQKAKDAIVDQFRSKTGRRPSVDTKNPTLPLNIHIHESNVTLSLDSSGDPLHRRGYRTQAGPAPLNEILAAGIIDLTGWTPDRLLVDPMCGSGTFIIEAAIKAAKLVPGRNRRFAFQRFKDYDPLLFKEIRQEAESKSVSELPHELVGSDMSGDAVREAQANAKRAGVGSFVQFERKKFNQQEPRGESGLMLFNPPYGERMAVGQIEEFYQSIGDQLKQVWSGHEAYILTGNPDAAKKIGLRPSRRVKLYNGPIECKLLKYEMYSGSRKSKYET